jgi:hypothetical protein
MTNVRKENRGGNLIMEILVRIILNLIFIQLEIVQPFNRKIHPDDIWQNHRNPITASYGKFFFICH